MALLISPQVMLDININPWGGLGTQEPLDIPRGLRGEQGMGFGIGTGWARLLRAPQALTLSHVLGSGIEMQVFFSQEQWDWRALSAPGFSNTHRHKDGLAVQLAKRLSQKWLECKRERGWRAELHSSPVLSVSGWGC